jgi:hypothetical protein
MHLDHLFHTIPNQPAEHAYPRPLAFWHPANFTSCCMPFSRIRMAFAPESSVSILTLPSLL